MTSQFSRQKTSNKNSLKILYLTYYTELPPPHLTKITRSVFWRKGKRIFLFLNHALKTLLSIFKKKLFFTKTSLKLRKITFKIKFFILFHLYNQQFSGKNVVTRNTLIWNDFTDFMNNKVVRPE